MNTASTTTPHLDPDFLANARACAQVIDGEVAKGRALADVLALQLSGGQPILAEAAWPYSTAISGKNPGTLV